MVGSKFYDTNCFGSEICEFKRNSKLIVRARMNSKTNSKWFSRAENHDDEVENLATQLGYTIVNIPKDGDCLFKSIAFQLFQPTSDRIIY